jgi:hypothetical protein
MRHRIMKFAFLLTLGSTVLFAGPFQNGGFESPVINTGSSPDFATVPTGWTKVDASNFALFMQFYSTFGLPTTGGQGTQAYGFGGNSITAGSLLQTFDTANGAGYHVSFQYVIQQGSGFEDLVAEVLNGAVSTIGSNSAGCTVGNGGCLANTGTVRFNNTAWVTRTLDFTATSTSATLRFSDFSGLESFGDPFSTNWALDAVSVTQTSGAPGVPEPSTFTLMSLALAALGWRWRTVQGSGAAPKASPR